MTLQSQTASRKAAEAVIGKSARYCNPLPLEASSKDGSHLTVADMTGNDVTRYTEFDEIPPVRCRYVRLTITGWPRPANPLGVVEFTVFGKPIVSASR